MNILYIAVVVLLARISVVGSQRHCDVLCDDDETHQASYQICASNGVTYASTCDYNNAACKALQNHTTIHMLYYGKCVTMATPCSELNHTRCPVGRTSAYVCGSDGRTYTTECSLAVARCRSLQDPNAAEIELDHYGHCEHLTNASRQVNCNRYFKIGAPAVAVEGGGLWTLQQLHCNYTRAAVCGLDGITYSNECYFCHNLALRHMITPSNMTAYISHDGYCQHYTVFG